jgi:hypothetical protein
MMMLLREGDSKEEEVVERGYERESRKNREMREAEGMKHDFLGQHGWKKTVLDKRLAIEMMMLLF